MRMVMPCLCRKCHQQADLVLLLVYDFQPELYFKDTLLKIKQRRTCDFITTRAFSCTALNIKLEMQS